MSFLGLPAELREMIYQYATDLRPSRLWIDSKESVPLYTALAVQPPWTATNRVIRSESLPIYYETNEFVLSLLDERSVRSFLQWITFNKHHLCHMNAMMLMIDADGSDGSAQQHGIPGWAAKFIALRFRNRTHRRQSAIAPSGTLHVLGVARPSRVLAPYIPQERWLLTAIDLVIENLAERLSEHGKELYFDIDYEYLLETDTGYVAIEFSNRHVGHESP